MVIAVIITDTFIVIIITVIVIAISIIANIAIFGVLTVRGLLVLTHLFC